MTNSNKIKTSEGNPQLQVRVRPGMLRAINNLGGGVYVRRLIEQDWEYRSELDSLEKSEGDNAGKIVQTEKESANASVRG